MRNSVFGSRTMLSCALWGVIVACAASTSSAQDAASAPRVSAANLPAGDATRGAQLYLKNGCWQCHGYGAATGTAPALVMMGFRADSFVSYLRNPRTRTMPLYSAKVVPDADAADIYAFIRAQKKPVEAREIPLLRQIMDEK